MRSRLRSLMERPAAVAAPGAFDPMSARQIELAGFELAYVGSYALSSRAGLPDVGLLDLTTMCNRYAAICDAVSIPIVADAEGGFFNAAAIGWAIRALERTGVAAIHIEDHISGKHSNQTKRISTAAEMVEKLRAAQDARTDRDFQIIARTDAIWAGCGDAETVDRMCAYLEAGADAVMPTGISTSRLVAIRSQILGKVVLVNSAGESLQQENDAGVDLALYPVLCAQAAHKAVTRTLEAFRASSRIVDIATHLSTYDELEHAVDVRALNDRAVKYHLTAPLS